MWSVPRCLAIAIACAVFFRPALTTAQDDPLAGDLDEPAESAPESTGAEPAAESAAEPAGEPDPAAAGGESSADVSASTSAGASGDLSATLSAAEVDADSLEGDPPKEPVTTSLFTSSHIRRPWLMADGTLVIDSPLATEIQGREYLQQRRQLGGAALPDTTAALGLFGPGTTPHLSLRAQPTLLLLNGRRLVSPPYHGERGADLTDLNQLPITLIDRVEITRGLAAGLYGDGAIGGVVNFVTKRDFDGVEIDAGAQVTDKFDQDEEDVTLTVGAGNERTGMTSMVSYFTRQPLAATDRDWIGERENRVESLTGSPGSYQSASNFEYPFPDPYCDLAIQAGHANGYEVRLRGYGPPETIELLPGDIQTNLVMINDMGAGSTFRLPTANNGVIDPYETATYCTSDFTPSQDLVLKDERFQTYSTLWHELSAHTEAYAEVGYYRSDNENRTAPSFPVNRITPDPNDILPVWVPREHADLPLQAKGFAAVEVDEDRFPNNQFLVGRVVGGYAGPNRNTRRVDVMRGVLGLAGDLKGVGGGSVLESWDWDVSGLYSSSEAISIVNDVLLDKLAEALTSCPATKVVEREDVPTTIKDRQEMGCFNPFYSAVVNSNVIDPLNLSASESASDNGFVTTDTDQPGDEAFGLQDGGFICDPNDPDSPPCPTELDALDGREDGVFHLAGTPNTKEVIDRIIGEQITRERRRLGTLDGVIRGDILQFPRGGIAFGLGAQYRRETLQIDYDAAYNQRLYGFLFGADDVPAVGRDIGAGFGELRLRLLDGVVELQPAVRLEHFSDVGTAFNALVGLSSRPFAGAMPPKALEYLLIRGHLGRGHVAPTLLQMHGSQTEFHSVEFNGRTHFIPYQIHGNTKLDFEKYTTLSAGVQWDFVGIHVGADFWMTTIDDVVAAANAQTLVYDCEQQFASGGGDCSEQFLLSMTRSLDHFESAFDNMAEVETNGIDGGVSYTLDSKKRGLGSFGTVMLGVQGSYLNTYLIKSPRALREFYRPIVDPTTRARQAPVTNPDGTRDYSGVSAEYDAAGWRNLDNFMPPLPKLRFSIPLRWLYEGHAVGATARYIGGYNDDSELTIEKYGLIEGAMDLTQLELATGEEIPAWTVFDVSYGYSFGDEGWKLGFTVGVINLLDEDPPAVESPLGYEVGLHDPRGRLVYARVTGGF